MEKGGGGGGGGGGEGGGGVGGGGSRPGQGPLPEDWHPVQLTPSPPTPPPNRRHSSNIHEPLEAEGELGPGKKSLVFVFRNGPS